MVIKLIIIGLLLFTNILTTSAQPCADNTNKHLDQQENNCALLLTGRAVIKGATFNAPITINGILDANNTQFTTLEVNGQANLQDCEFSANANIKGQLVAYSTKFNTALTVEANYIKLVNSVIQGDLVMRQGDGRKQTVVLLGATLITGNITFVAGQGEVVVKGQSRVKGKVIGGKIIA